MEEEDEDEAEGPDDNEVVDMLWSMIATQSHQVLTMQAWLGANGYVFAQVNALRREGVRPFGDELWVHRSIPGGVDSALARLNALRTRASS